MHARHQILIVAQFQQSRFGMVFSDAVVRCRSQNIALFV
jgi:hypothetical protein